MLSLSYYDCDHAVVTCCCHYGVKVYSRPRQLPCVHTFCLSCLERTGVNKRAGDTVECPLCSQQFNLPLNGFVGLPRNKFLEELAEVSRLIC